MAWKLNKNVRTIPMLYIISQSKLWIWTQTNGFIMMNFKTTEYSVLRDTIEVYEVSLCKKNYNNRRHFACSKHFTEVNN